MLMQIMKAVKFV